MIVPQLSERSVRIAVLGFSLIGVIVLAVIASLTEVEDIHIWEAEDHVGERVRISGTALGTYPSTSDSAWLLLMEKNSTIEVFIERGEGDIEPGSMIRAEGEIINIDEVPTMTIQNEDRLVKDDPPDLTSIEDGITPGEVYYLQGVVRSARYLGWDHQEIVILPILKIGTGSSPVIIELIKFDEGLKTGDVVNITALFTDNKRALAYGTRDIEILSRAEPRTVSLLRLVEEMRDDPGSAPYEPVTLDGYIRYPPMGKSIYISDIVEGGDISIKVKLPIPLDGAEKGDLVRLYNCSLFWDVKGLRFELRPEEAQIVESYGPWILNLETLENGLFEYEGALVEISGIVIEEGTSFLLVSGESTVPLKNWVGAIDMIDTIVTGRVLFDGYSNSLYIETGVGIS